MWEQLCALLALRNRFVRAIQGRGSQGGFSLVGTRTLPARLSYSGWRNAQSAAWCLSPVHLESKSNALRGGSLAEGAEDIGQRENAFELAKIGSVDNRQHRPVTRPAQHLLQRFIREDQG